MPVCLYQKFDKLPTGDWKRAFRWKRGDDQVGPLFESGFRAMEFAKNGPGITSAEFEEYLAEMRKNFDAIGEAFAKEWEADAGAR